MEISLMQMEVMEAMQDYILKKYGCRLAEDETLGMWPHVVQPVYNKSGNRVINRKHIPFCEMCTLEWFVADVDYKEVT